MMKWAIWLTHIMNCKINSWGQGNLRRGWCHDLAKHLSHFYFIFIFIFLLFWTYYYKDGAWEDIMWLSHKVTKCDISHVTMSWVTVTTCDEVDTYDGNNMRTIGGHCTVIVVKYISSVENQTGTLLSFPCQLRLGVDLSCLG